MSGIGVVVKIVDSHPCGWGSIPGKTCSFFIVSLSKGLSLYFMCSNQHVKYWMPRELPLTSSLLLDYDVKQYIHARAHTHTHTHACLQIHPPKAEGMYPTELSFGIAKFKWSIREG